MKLVEDEWERDLQSEEDLDLLFVKYDPQKIKLDRLKQTITEHGFDPKIRTDMKK